MRIGTGWNVTWKFSIPILFMFIAVFPMSGSDIWLSVISWASTFHTFVSHTVPTFIPYNRVWEVLPTVHSFIISHIRHLYSDSKENYSYFAIWKCDCQDLLVLNKVHLRLETFCPTALCFSEDLITGRRWTNVSVMLWCSGQLVECPFLVLYEGIMQVSVSSEIHSV